MPAKSRLDETDIKILKSLLKNSRRKFSEIAKELKISTATVKNRYKELKKSGIIKGSTTILNLSFFDVMSDTLVSVNVDDSQVDDFIEYVKKNIGIPCDYNPLDKEYNAIMWSSLTNLSKIERIKELIRRHPAAINFRVDFWIYMKVLPDNLGLKLLG